MKKKIKQVLINNMELFDEGTGLMGIPDIDEKLENIAQEIVKLFAIPDVSNRALLRVVPVYDGSGTSVTIYKLVDENGNILMMADKATCEWRKEYGY